KSRRISTSGNKDLKSFRINTSKKQGRGVGGSGECPKPDGPGLLREPDCPRLFAARRSGITARQMRDHGLRGLRGLRNAGADGWAGEVISGQEEARCDR